MAKVNVKYRVHGYESERGWGRSYEHSDFDTRAEAEAYIKRVNEGNAADYARTKRVPDCYFQVEDKIEIIEQ